MIGATSGRVHYVDGNSGHYRPAAAHLHVLIVQLAVNHVFTRDACTEVKGQDMPIDDYLYELPRSFFGSGVTPGSHRGRG